MSLTLIPAYGRDYKSQREVLEHWRANKDFIVAGDLGGIGRPGQTASLSCVPKGTVLVFRFQRFTKAFTHIAEGMKEGDEWQTS